MHTTVTASRAAAMRCAVAGCFRSAPWTPAATTALAIPTARIRPLFLSQAARTVGRGFEERLAEAGGSTSTWLILLSLVSGGAATQSELAANLGIRGPTLTHHLSALERDGLLTRTRLPDDRRAQRVDLTSRGRTTFRRLRRVARAHDERLREGFTEDELAQLRVMLARMAANAAGSDSAASDGSQGS